MQPPFGSDFFKGNRTNLRERLKLDIPIVVTANGQLQASNDNPLPFKQDPSFWYLTGIEQPDYILVIDKHKTYIISPIRSAIQDLFDGTASLEAVQQTSGVDMVLGAEAGWAKLKASLQKTKQVAAQLSNPAYIPVYGMYTNPARAHLMRRLRSATQNLEIIDIRPELAKLRVIKQAPEIVALRKAIDITVDTLNAVQKKTYSYEYELEADITRDFRWNGASGHGYAPIVAGGKNACILHYLDNIGALEPHELVLMDVGAAYNQYTADLTRTWSQDAPTDRQIDVFNAVNEALLFGIEQLKPGEASFRDCEQRVREFVGKKLKELKLIDHIDKAGIAEYYPHAPHYLGLDVHDVGDTRQPLRPGMVMTLEPGIYIPDERIGIRLEEDILITETGCEVLSKACPRTLVTVQ